MAVAFKAAGAAVTGGSGATLSPSWPAHVTGDLGILICATSYNTHTVPADPAGWTQVGSITGVAGGVKNVTTVWWRRAASDAEAAPGVVVPATDPSCIAQIVTYSGCLTSATPVEAVAGFGSSPGTYPSLTMLCPGDVTTEDNRHVVNVFAGFLSDGAEMATSYSNIDIAFVEDSDVVQVVGGEEMGISVASGVLATAGPFNTTSATASASVYTSYGAISFALKAEPDPVVEDEAPVASLGGIMTIVLLARAGARRERQVIYGKKHPMRRK